MKVGAGVRICGKLDFGEPGERSQHTVDGRNPA